MIRLILLTPLLCACDLNPLAGKPSAFQQHMGKTMAEQTEAVEAAPVALVMAETEAPECIYDSFRVYRCSGGETYDWWTGEKL